MIQLYLELRRWHHCDDVLGAKRRGPALGTWRSEVSSQKASDPQCVGSAAVGRAVRPDRVS
eukprot:6798859-Prymnesium_polylepis.1